MRPEDFRDTTPVFRIEDYFRGETRAWGIVQDRAGTLRREFTVAINGQWEGEEFVLYEDFVYRDGERSQRIWRIRKLDDHRYEGRAADVAGVAVGTAYGSALNWQYDLLLTLDGRTWKVRFNDWMFLQDDGVLVNRATMTKFGVRVGEVTLFFRREPSS